MLIDGQSLPEGLAATVWINGLENDLPLPDQIGALRTHLATRIG
jgi:hypothetical protein